MKKISTIILLLLSLSTNAQLLEVSAKGGICVSNVGNRATTNSYFYGSAADVQSSPKFASSLSINSGTAHFRFGVSVSYYNIGYAITSLDINARPVGEVRYQYGNPLLPIELNVGYRSKAGPIIVDAGALFGFTVNSQYVIEDDYRKSTILQNRGETWMTYGGYASFQVAITKSFAAGIEAQPKIFNADKRANFLMPFFAKISYSIL